MDSNSEFTGDKLKILRGRPIKVSDLLTIYQPTLGQIEEFGEKRFFEVAWLMCSCAWDIPATYADLGIDFMTVSDWMYFIQTVHSLTAEDTKLIFGDLDFSKLTPMNYKSSENDTAPQIVLVNTEPINIQGIEYQPAQYFFTEQLYHDMIPYVREMIGFSHKGRKAANKATAKILIMEDRKNRERHKNDKYESYFHNGIISLVNTEEFSYTYETVFDITMYQFTKSLLQIQGKKQACAMYQGSMSGFVDTSKIPSINFQWVYSEDKYNRRQGKTLKDSLAPNGQKLKIKSQSNDIAKK